MGLFGWGPWGPWGPQRAAGWVTAQSGVHHMDVYVCACVGLTRIARPVPAKARSDVPTAPAGVSNSGVGCLVVRLLRELWHCGSGNGACGGGMDVNARPKTVVRPSSPAKTNQNVPR